VALVTDPAARDDVRNSLAEQRIQTSLHYPPIHLFSCYRGNGGRNLPRTEEAAARLVTLPLFAHMRDEQVDAVCDALIAAV
jgi:dTDP-4-amino-4,6-dideoxygalactose transaminase